MDALKETAREIQEETGATVVPIRADMTSTEDITMLVWSTISELGHIDILVNNAVNSTTARASELPDEVILNHINTKVMGYIRCSREVITSMRKKGGGRIVNIAGMGARNSSATNPGSRQMQLIDERAQRDGVSSEEVMSRTVANVPIGRMVEPDDIANLVLFLVSNQASAITGQTIAVDGGAGRGIIY